MVSSALTNHQVESLLLGIMGNSFNIYSFVFWKSTDVEVWCPALEEMMGCKVLPIGG